MADDLEAIAETELVESEQPDEHEATETASPEADEAEGDAETGDEEAQEGDDESGEADDEIVDLDFAFGKYQVPKKLRDDVLNLQKNFTQKTQDFSTRSKALEQREAALEQQAKVTEQDLTTRAELSQVEAELKRFENWGYAEYQAASLNDPIGAQQAWAYKADLQQRQGALKNAISEREAERSQEAQRDYAKRVEETLAYAQTLKGWTPETDQKLARYAEQVGIDQSFVQRNMSPKFIEVLHHAMIGADLLNKQVTAPKPKPAQQPLKKVASKSNPKPAGLSDDLSIEEWTARRQKQLASR